MDDIERVAQYMQEQGLVLATGESCTAGLIAATLADIPGAGALLDCAFVVYSPSAKMKCLEVRKQTIDAYGLTSVAVSREMALGALARGRANVAIANTGVTDDMPDGPPAGTQCFAWAFKRSSDQAQSHGCLPKPRYLSGRATKSARRAPTLHCCVLPSCIGN